VTYHHTLIVADHPSAYRDTAEPVTRLARGSSDRGHINDWRRTFIFTPGERSGRDWNFETPKSIPQGMTPSLISVPGNAAYQLYEFPGRFLDPQAAEVATRLRMQSTEADFERVEGRSTVRGLAPGQRFTPVEIPHPDTIYAPQVIVQILHRIDDPTYETNSGAPNYENEFSVMPADVPATPHRLTPRPRTACRSPWWPGRRAKRSTPINMAA
jgi:type VI secretion system secreted protein VgrG